MNNQIEIVKAPVEILYNKIKNLDKFIKHLNLDSVLNEGGFIAGGFPRYMINKGELDLTYFTNEPSEGKRNHFTPGDIDVFFKDECQYENLVKKLSQSYNDIEQSRAGYAINKHEKAKKLLIYYAVC